MELPFLVQRQCRDTARQVGLLDRGVLAPGYRADVNVIDFDALQSRRPEIRYDLPAGGKRLLQQADGYRHTFVRGVETYRDGEHHRRAARPARPRRPAGTGVKERVALVTGASRGIGAAIAARFAGAGAAVAVTARTVEEGDHVYEGSITTTVRAINDAGGNAIAIPADLSKEDDRLRLVNEVNRQLGPVDILVNNAAITYFEPRRHSTSGTTG